MRNDTNVTTYIVEEYLAQKVERYIWKIVPPIMIGFGSIGNILSIITLVGRHKLRRHTCFLFLTVLAIADLLVLYFGLLRQWIRHVYQWDIRESSGLMCKVHVFLTYTMVDFSAFILSAVTIERVVVVWLPHKGKRFCKKSRAGVIITVLAISLALLNSHFLYGMGIVQLQYSNFTHTLHCDSTHSDYSQFLDYIWPWIDFSTFCVIPFVILFVGNIFIVVKVVLSRRSLRKNEDSGDFVQVRHNTGYMSSMNLVLFLLNTVFLICNTPISIFLIGYVHWFPESSPQGQATPNLIWTICTLLMYLNNTINFLLYCISGSRFRREAKMMFCKASVAPALSIQLTDFTYTNSRRLGVH